jgi:hypothetical protein
MNQQPKISFKGLLTAALLLALPILLLYWYNYSALDFQFAGINLKKIDTPAPDGIFSDTNEHANLNGRESQGGISPADSFFQNPDTLPHLAQENTDSIRKESSGSDSSRTGIATQGPASDSSANKLAEGLASKDSSSQRILLIGDSQAGGIMYAFNDYCIANGHSLVGVFTWYSATTYNFAYSKRMEELIDMFKPSLIVLVLGLNELYARDLKAREKAARQIQSKFGNIPYLWVGPANFMEDQGINRIYQETAGPGRFFLSKHLEIPRGGDKRHPNKTGYKIWMDSIAGFVQTSDKYSFGFLPPKKAGSRIKAKVITANAAKNREY